MKPEVVDSTSYSSVYPANSVLLLGEQDEVIFGSNFYNFWLAEQAGWSKTGQGFTLRVDTCIRLIEGCQVKNLGAGRHTQTAAKGFRVSGSVNMGGPWKILLEDELADTRGKPAPLINFTFEEPVEIQFLKFDLVSFWGTHGGGLQYFAAIPATSKTMILRHFCQDNICLIAYISVCSKKYAQ